MKKLKKNIDKASNRNFKMTNELVKENLMLSKNIYDKIEKGDFVLEDNNSPNFIDLKDYNPIKSSKSNNCLQRLGLNFSFNKEKSSSLKDLIDFDNMSANYNKNNSDSEFSDMDDNVETKV